MKRFITVLLGVGLLAGVTALVSAEALLSPLGQGGAGRWVIMGEDPVIIGGYGDNFAYNGRDVKPLKGYLTVDLDTRTKRGKIEAVVWTTPESGPIRFSSNQQLEGEIRWVQEFSGAGRIAEFIWLHGDSGIEEPVLPSVFNWLATWAPITLYHNGNKVVTQGGHSMFSPNTRKPNGAVSKGRTIYSPQRRAESGWFEPQQYANPIFHVVTHSDVPDRNNFPPHSNWFHVNFQTLYVLRVPDGVNPTMIPQGQ